MAGVRPPLTWSCKRALQVVLYPWEEATQHLGGFSKKLDGFSAVLRFSVYPFSVSGDSWYHRWCDQLLHPPVHTSEGVNSDPTAAWRRVLLTGTVAIFILINSSETERQAEKWNNLPTSQEPLPRCNPNSFHSSDPTTPSPGLCSHPTRLPEATQDRVPPLLCLTEQIMWHMGAPTCPSPLQRSISPCVWVQQMLAAVSWRFWTSAVITSGKESSEACTIESTRSQHRHTSQSYTFLRLVNIFPASLHLTDNCPSDPFSQKDLFHPWVRGHDFIEKKSNWRSGSWEKWKEKCTTSAENINQDIFPPIFRCHSLLEKRISIQLESFCPCQVKLDQLNQRRFYLRSRLKWINQATHQWKNPNQGGI